MPSLLSLQRFGQDRVGLVQVRRSFSKGGSTSFVRTLVARLTLPRPPHPAPYVRDDREAPLLWERDGVSSRDDLGRLRSGIFLREGLYRLMGDLPVGRVRPPEKLHCNELRVDAFGSATS